MVQANESPELSVVQPNLPAPSYVRTLPAWQILKPPPKKLVVLAVVEKKLVVVAEVPVALMKVKFWRVEEPTVRRLPAWLIENLVVEATLRSRRLPEKPVRASAPMTVPVELKCSTESLA